MPFEDMSLGDYYFLRDRHSFSIDPWRDSAIYFGSRSMSEQIERRIETDFVQPRGIPKFFIFGVFGSGKTHTLAHIHHKLKNMKVEAYKTEPIYLDIAPLSSKERYERIHSRLLDAIGLDRLVEAAEVVADRVQGRDKIDGFINELKVVPFGDDALKSSVANIYRNILFGGRQRHLSWEWMKGKKTSVDDSQMLQVQKHLEEPQEYVHCLLNLGALYFAGTGKRIVFLVDEAEAFGSVTNPDSEAEMRHVLRLFLENSNTCVGIILASQTEGGMESLPRFFTTDDIRRRVDFDQGYIDLNGLVANPGDAESFIRDTIQYLVDRDKARGTIEQESLKVSEDLFPFAQEAVTAIAEQVSNDVERRAPAPIISWLGNSAIEAWRRRSESSVHQLITREIVEEIIFPNA